ncbi:MAG: DUF1540 domain-containing protein [Thermoanaerobacteraceae bacterium]|nr:DUF1540 domain-containing protein [Thermoanaerobacteraceae bacterium]
MDGPKVKCTVNTCVHWLKGNQCNANNIDITHEEEGKMSHIAEHTQCKTFYQRRGVANTLGSLDNVNWGGWITSTLLPGSQVYPAVTCTVSSCEYWVEGNRCRAPEIDVVGANADECQDTNCYTFRPKAAP